MGGGVQLRGVGRGGLRGVGRVWGPGGGGTGEWRPRLYVQVGFEAIYRWKTERALAYATYRIDMNLIRLDEISHIIIVKLYIISKFSQYDMYIKR